MNDPVQIITTGDGSHSLLNTTLNETYHSVHGALRESLHVFIKHGLEYFVNNNQSKNISIFEVGFGTGLNALLTAQFAHDKNIHVDYTSIEAFPLHSDVISKLNYAQSPEQKELFEKIHGAEWEKSISISTGFSIHKVKTTLQLIDLSPFAFDVVFFDAFAPSKQPEMWEISVLQKIYNAVKSPGVFVTYCAKGQLKRDLKNLGFEVQTLGGPPGKKEMVRALKN
jgi:tRNA U34 5-methylaminomethyl-2-thiouridine-forming methyltransferase MnmC